MLAEAGLKANRSTSLAQAVYLLSAESVWGFKWQLSKTVDEMKAIKYKGPASGSGNP